MTFQSAMLIGGAGTGKTTELLQIMEKTLQAGVPDPLKIGFVSFTRPARREASTRAGDQFGIKPEELEREGWFRTVHSICYRCLGVKSDELITDNKESREWLKEAMQAEVSGAADSESGVEQCFESHTEADVALQLWAAARNRLVPLEEIWRIARDCDTRVPDFEACAQLIRRYESAKYQDDRLDFTDLLGQFAGYKFRVEGHEKREPQGWVPEVPVWFLDEWQDASALLNAVALRLVENSKWVYVVGDPFQAIYGWAGSDAAHFMSWPVQEGKRRIMPKSWRCPPEILGMGEAFLRQCSDYWDRGIAPADRHGTVDSTAYLTKQLVGSLVDPRESWLLIGRTNFQARRMAQLLDAHNIPWVPTKGGGGWDAPVRNAAMQALLDLESGSPIDGWQWAQILKYTPSKLSGQDLLTRGTKTRFEALTQDQAMEQFPFVLPSELSELGATEQFCELVRSRKWRQVIEHAERYTYAAERWGAEVIKQPGVRVGTIHSVKGSEADNVMMSMGISAPIVRGRARRDGRNEEQRVFYVGATRARERLVMVTDHRAPENMKIPA